MTVDNILAIVFSAGSIAVIVHDLRHPARATLLRAVPFTVIAIISIVAAGRAPKGHHPASFDFSLAAADVARSLTKVAHWRSIAVLFLLAVVAVTVRRLTAAFLLTMAVGVGWELAECTSVGHYARLADLAPNACSAATVLLLLYVMRRSIPPAAPRDAERPSAATAPTSTPAAPR